MFRILRKAMRHRFETEVWVGYPMAKVFDLLANPENLPRIMPAWQKLRIESAKLTTPPSEEMPHVPHAVAGEGSELYVTFRPVPFLPLRKGWRVLISEFVYRLNEPRENEQQAYFCDTQLAGPFAYWHHCHRVRREDRDGVEGAVVRDEVEYELPLAPVSDWADGCVQANLAGVFRYRQAEMRKMLAAD